MMKRISFAVLAVAVVSISAQQVLAGSISIATSQSTVNAVQEAAGAPAGWTVYDFTVTTSGDILSIGNVTTIGTYNSPLGTDTGESPFSAFPGFEQLQVDSWITTPGAATSILGGDGALDGDGNESWVDLSDDGAQVNFLFARLTVDPATPLGFFTGQVTIAGDTGPENFPFSLPIPEPATFGLAGFGLLGMLVSRRRSA